MSQVLGIATIKVNGEQLNSKEGAKLNLGGIQRTPVVAGSKVHYTERVMPSGLECTLLVTKDTNATKMNTWRNVTITFEGDNGKKYTVNGAFTTEPLEVTDGNGEMPLKLSGPPAEED